MRDGILVIPVLLDMIFCGLFMEMVTVALVYSSDTHERRVSFEISFDSKQPKLEPKLVSALSKTERLFRLFRFYTETESFDVSKPKQTEDQPKLFDREHILLFFTENSGFFGCFFRFFSFFRFVSKQFVPAVSLSYRNRVSETETNKRPTQTV